MAAELKPSTRSANDRFCSTKKPILLAKLEGFNYGVNGLVILTDDDGIITISDDKSVRVWLKRDSGQYWPSVHQLLPSGATSIDYFNQQRLLFIGQENGTVSQFALSSDNNMLQFIRDYLSHRARVTSVCYSYSYNWVMSISRDTSFALYSTQTGNKISEIFLDSWCSSLAFDNQTKHAFVGDYSGRITLLKLSSDGHQVVTAMKGHNSVVSSLAWHSDKQFLFSGAYDNMIIVWDIGSRKGSAYELQGHQSKVTAICYLKSSKQLVSVGEDGVIIFWDMDKDREETPDWVDADACMQCRKPFFWNIKGMMDQRQLGLRQHHCRHCGKAVCDRCSAMAVTIPNMGFEMPVRVCEKCCKFLQSLERPSLATFHDSKHSIVTMAIDEKKKRMVTAGQDHIIKIWDISDLL